MARARRRRSRNARESSASEELPVTAIVSATNTAIAVTATTTSSHETDARRTDIASSIKLMTTTTRSVMDEQASSAGTRSEPNWELASSWAWHVRRFARVERTGVRI